MLKNTNHDVMPSAEQSAHLAGRVMVVDGQAALVGITPANGAAMILSGQGLGVPFGRDAVVPLQFFAPFDFSPLRRLLVTLDGLATRFGQAIGAHVGRFLGSQDGVLFWRSHAGFLTPTAYGCQAITP